MNLREQLSPGKADNDPNDPGLLSNVFTFAAAAAATAPTSLGYHWLSIHSCIFLCDKIDSELQNN